MARKGFLVLRPGHARVSLEVPEADSASYNASRMETLVALGLVMAAFWIWLRRQGELFRLSVRAGRVLVVRGRVPQGLVDDFRPVVKHVRSGDIHVQKTSSGGRLTTRGIDDDTTQRLRNLLGIRSLASLVGALPLRAPTLGQRLGIAWLAWWSHDRERARNGARPAR